MSGCVVWRFGLSDLSRLSQCPRTPSHLSTKRTLPQGKWQFAEVMLKGLEERAARHKLERQAAAAAAAGSAEGRGEEEEEVRLLTDLRVCLVRALLATPGQLTRGAALRSYYGGWVGGVVAVCMHLSSCFLIHSTYRPEIKQTRRGDPRPTAGRGGRSAGGGGQAGRVPVAALAHATGGRDCGGGGSGGAALLLLVPVS